MKRKSAPGSPGPNTSKRVSKDDCRLGVLELVTKTPTKPVPRAIHLDPRKKAKFTCGRGVKADIHVDTTKPSPNHISRIHAEFEYNSTQQTWTIFNKGLNSFAVNGKKTKTGQHTFEHGDVLCIGGVVTDLKYKFTYLRRPTSDVLRSLLSSAGGQRKSPTTAPAEARARKRKAAEATANAEELELLRKKVDEMQKKQRQQAEMLQRAQQEQEQAKKQAMEANAQLKALQESNAQKQTELENKQKEQLQFFEAERQRIEETLKNQLNAKNAEARANEEARKKAEEEMKQLAKAREDLLKAHQEEHAKLLAERQRLDKQSAELKHTVESVREEKLNLESKLSSLKSTVEKLHKEKGMETETADTIKTEATCCVCVEIAVQATALGCGHTFCRQCLFDWMEKHDNCPICREDVRALPVRARQLDTIIASYLKRADDEEAEDWAKRSTEAKLRQAYCDNHLSQLKELAAKTKKSDFLVVKNPNLWPLADAAIARKSVEPANLNMKCRLAAAKLMGLTLDFIHTACPADIRYAARNLRVRDPNGDTAAIRRALWLWVVFRNCTGLVATADMR